MAGGMYWNKTEKTIKASPTDPSNFDLSNITSVLVMNDVPGIFEVWVASSDKPGLVASDYYQLTDASGFARKVTFSGKQAVPLPAEAFAAKTLWLKGGVGETVLKCSVAGKG